MSDNTRLTESLADIQSKLTRFTWEVMDEEQRDEVMNKVVLPRWGKTTRDGHTLKGILWAEILGTSVTTIESRRKRINARLAEETSRSDGTSELAGGISETERNYVRHAKSVTRSPQAVKALVADPEVRAALTEAMGPSPALEAQQAAANKARREEQEKAETARQAALLEAERNQAQAVAKEQEKLKHIEELLRASIKAEPPTPEVLAEMAKQAFSSDDPNIVQKMVDAYGEHVATRLANEVRTKRERAIEAARNKAENEVNKAVKRASLEYDDSALRLFNEVYDDAYEAHLLLSRKMVTFSNLVASGFTMGELLARCTSMVNFATEMKTAIENAGAEGLIDEAMADVSLDEN